MFRRLALAAALALPVAAAAVPVRADGQIALTFTPRTREEADLMRLGLGLYALHRRIEAGGTVRQTGEGHAAGLFQHGRGNWGLIDQRGSGHVGTLTQTGTGHAHALFQTGRNTTAHVSQTGTRGVGLTFVHGF
jgi:hypothetical protein